MIDAGEYLIDADERSVTLYKKTTTAHGEIRKRVVGHYATLHRVAEVLATLPAHHAIGAGHDVASIIRAVETATADILTALTPAVPQVHPGQGQLLP